jgi:hypothetical protein
LVFMDALVIADVYGSLFVLFHLVIVLYVLLTLQIISLVSSNFS